jgi:hypothetical protein
MISHLHRFRLVSTIPDIWFAWLYVADDVASPPRHHANTPVTPQAQAGPSKHTSRSPEAEQDPEPAPRFVHRRSPPMVRRHGKEPALPEVIEHLEPEHSRNRGKSGSPTAADIPRERDVYRSRPPPQRQEEPAPARTHSRYEYEYESRTERPVPLPRPVETRPPDLPPAPPASAYHTTPPRAVFQPAPAPAHVPIQSEVRPYTQTAPLPPAIEPTRQTAPAPPQTQSQLENNKRGFIVCHPLTLK